MAGAPGGLRGMAGPAVHLLFECTARAAVDGKSFLTVRPVVALPIVAVVLARTVAEAPCGIDLTAAFNTRWPPPRVPVDVIERTDPDEVTTTTYCPSPMVSVVPVQPAFWLSSYMARESPASAAYWAALESP